MREHVTDSTGDPQACPPRTGQHDDDGPQAAHLLAVSPLVWLLLARRAAPAE